MDIIPKPIKDWFLRRLGIDRHRIAADIARDLAPVVAEAVSEGINAAMTEYARIQDAKADALEKADAN